VSDKLLKEAIQKISPTRYVDYRKYLKALYEYIKAADTTYSYRQYSDDLGFGASTVIHQIVKGYRPLSTRNGTKIAKVLGLKKKDRLYFFALIDYNNAKKVKEKDERFDKLLKIKSESLPSELDQNMLQYFSEWYHPVIRELVGMQGFVNDPEWIEKRLTPSVTQDQIKKSLRLLKDLGMIHYDEVNDTYTQSQTVIDSGPGVKGMGLLGYHQSMLDRAKESLTTIKAKRRNISAVTVRCSEERAQKIKALIQSFQSELVAIAEGDEEDESIQSENNQIYQINFQLFPFTEES